VLGGPDDERIIVPQWRYWQRHGRWREMEREVHALAVAELDGSRPGFGLPPTRALYYVVDVIYTAFDHFVCPTLRTWAFPARFVVQVFRCDLRGNHDPGQPIRRWNFDGAPTDETFAHV
jgi:hypothetical protein